VLLAVSRAPEAIAAYEEALRLRPGAAAIHANLGAAYLSTNDLARAETNFRAALAGDASLFAAWYYLGEILRATGRSEEAKQALREALRLRPGEARASAALAALGG
jgi:tetratricopeptide (TPR) repeat protein